MTQLNLASRSGVLLSCSHSTHSAPLCRARPPMLAGRVISAAPSAPAPSRPPRRARAHAADRHADVLSQRECKSSGRRGLLIGGTTLSVCAPCGSCCQACAADAAAVASPSLYERYLATVLSAPAAGYEAQLEERKRALFEAHLRPGDDLVELGLGAAPNARFYGRARLGSVTGVEINASFAERAGRSASEAGVDLHFVRGAAEALPLEDSSADVVVSTLVWCSVEDPERAMREAVRVLRPGGTLLMLEHVAAESGSARLLRQRALEPLQKLLAGGCNLTRRTGALVVSLTEQGACECTGEPHACEGALSADRGLAPAFARARVEGFSVDGADLISPHVQVVAIKA